MERHTENSARLGADRDGRKILQTGRSSACGGCAETVIRKSGVNNMMLPSASRPSRDPPRSARGPGPVVTITAGEVTAAQLRPPPGRRDHVGCPRRGSADDDAGGFGEGLGRGW